MSKQRDIRWEQRFSNYVKAFTKLNQAVTKIKEDNKIGAAGSIDEDEFLDAIIKEGFIQRFKYTHELAWNVMKDFLGEIGDVKIYGSKDATREAFAADLISDGDSWMDMILSRNRTSYTYNEETSDDIFIKILNDYHPAFKAFLQTMEEKRSSHLGKIV